MSWTHELKSHFQKLSQQIFSDLKNTEELSLGLTAEFSDFVRLNQNKLRQSTHVEQKSIEMTLQSNNRKIIFDTSITGDFSTDIQRLQKSLNKMRDEVTAQPENPHVFSFVNNGQSETDHGGSFPDIAELTRSVIDVADECDLAGMIASGPMVRAATNSKGQNHWFSNHSFFVDYSLYTQSEGTAENKAVKGNYAGSSWSEIDLKSNLQVAKNQLSLLRKPSISVKPGRYKTYLAPGAVSEILGCMSNWALGAKAYNTGGSPLAKLADGKEKLSPKFSLKENFNLGLCPRFNSLGELAPEEMFLIEKGEHKNWITSTHSAKEFGLKANAGEVSGWGYEPIRSPEILPGDLPQANALKELGTGLYLSNLHYINFSDLASARITGMTRYACFWVENGEILAPIKDLRFDESLYLAFGANLIDLSKESETEVSIDTYYLRGIGGKKIPGALINDFHFTL